MPVLSDSDSGRGRGLTRRIPSRAAELRVQRRDDALRGFSSGCESGTLHGASDGGQSDCDSDAPRGPGGGAGTSAGRARSPTRRRRTLRARVDANRRFNLSLAGVEPRRRRAGLARSAPRGVAAPPPGNAATAPGLQANRRGPRQGPRPGRSIPSRESRGRGSVTLAAEPRRDVAPPAAAAARAPGRTGRRSAAAGGRPLHFQVSTGSGVTPGPDPPARSGRVQECVSGAGRPGGRGGGPSPSVSPGGTRRRAGPAGWPRRRAGRAAGPASREPS